MDTKTVFNLVKKRGQRERNRCFDAVLAKVVGGKILIIIIFDNLCVVFELIHFWDVSILPTDIVHQSK